MSGSVFFFMFLKAGSGWTSSPARHPHGRQTRSGWIQQEQEAAGRPPAPALPVALCVQTLAPECRSDRHEGAAEIDGVDHPVGDDRAWPRCPRYPACWPGRSRPPGSAPTPACRNWRRWPPAVPVENPATTMPSAKAGAPVTPTAVIGGVPDLPAKAPARRAGGGVEGQHQVVLDDHGDQPARHERGGAGREVQRLAPQDLAGARIQRQQPRHSRCWRRSCRNHRRCRRRYSGWWRVWGACWCARVWWPSEQRKGADMRVGIHGEDLAVGRASGLAASGWR